jgi:F420-dependent oxidoreductase-like protein
MKIAISAHYSRGHIGGQIDEILEFERAGVDVIWVAESYSFDSVSAMGFLAARTRSATIASGIMNIYSRTPALLAMTAAGLDALSGGRFMLGLGASGPQVIEGFHALPYDAPVARLREVVEICRKVWRRDDKLTHDGDKYHIPLPQGEGSGLGKPLKLINHPHRPDVPIALATLGEKSVEMTAEIAEAWLPAFFMAEKAHTIWGDALRRGQAKRDPALPPLQVYAGGTVAIGENVESLREAARPNIALYVGGMGAREKNFYNQVFRKYGFDKEAEAIQDLYLSGRKSAAEAAVPEAFLRATSLVGSEGFVRDRLQAYKASGVTCLNASFAGTTTRERVKNCDTLRNLLEKI